MKNAIEKMEYKEVKNKVHKAIAAFIKHDNYLLTHNLNERTIAHKLAVYLQKEFPQYHVDCEYNGNIDEVGKRKLILILKSECRRLGVKMTDDEQKSTLDYIQRNVYPDIIVHTRDTNDQNVLAIEIKKTKNKTPREYDYLKLKKYTKIGEVLGYDWGLFIEFETGKEDSFNRDLLWFKDARPYDAEQEINQEEDGNL